MNPFDAVRNVAGLWERGGEAYLKAQTDLLSGMATWMASTARPADSADLPPDSARATTPDAQPAGRDTAQRAFDRSWATAREVAETAMAHLAERQTGQDPPDRTALERIFDPGAWFVGTDGAIEATDGLPDGRGAAVLEAWSVLRRRNLEHATVMLEAWMQAAGSFARELGREPAGDESADALAGRWVMSAKRALAETRKSDAFMGAQRALMEAAGDLKVAQAEFGIHLAEVYGHPTRADVDALGKTVAELRREVRALQRALRMSRGREGEQARR